MRYRGIGGNIWFSKIIQAIVYADTDDSEEYCVFMLQVHVQEHGVRRA